MKIAIGSDHAGFPLKEEIRKYFDEKGIEYVDCGVYDASSADYPVQAKNTCEKIVSGECVRGILCCGTGIGISMAANKVKGIRAACCSDYFSAKYTRLHNDANVLCLGARVIGAPFYPYRQPYHLERAGEGLLPGDKARPGDFGTGRQRRLGQYQSGHPARGHSH